MAKVHIEINEHELKQVVVNYLSTLTGISLTDKDVSIETKSAQNYRSEWERAEFRARVDKTVA